MVAHNAKKLMAYACIRPTCTDTLSLPVGLAVHDVGYIGLSNR